jgi:hypothetical protein
MHKPGIASLMGQRGGRRRAIFCPEDLETFDEPRTPQDMLRALAKVAVQVHRSQLDPRVCNAVVYASAAHFRGTELEGLKEIRKEIDELKANWRASQRGV